MNPLSGFYRSTGTHYLQFKYNVSAATGELGSQMDAVRRVYAACYGHIVKPTKVIPRTRNESST